MDLESRLSEAEKEAHTGKIISVAFSIWIHVSFLFKVKSAYGPSFPSGWCLCPVSVA